VLAGEGGSTDGDLGGVLVTVDADASGCGTAAREAEGAATAPGAKGDGGVWVAATGGSAVALRLLRPAHPTQNAVTPTIAVNVRAESNLWILE
jgi:hypothetical protein